MSYPVTHLTLTAEDAGTLRRLHASGAEVAVLARARELSAGAVERFTTDRAWEPIDLCLRGYHSVGGGQSVFGRRDYDIRVLDAGEVAVTATALSAVSQEWLRDRFARRLLAEKPGPIQPCPGAGFDEVWEGFTGLTGFFARASRERQCVLFFAPSKFWRPPRLEAGPDGGTRVVRPHYRPEDYTVDPNSTRSLPADGGSWPFEADLCERDGVLYSWTEVDRFIRGGRTWVRMTNSDSEYYIDVENADDRIGRIEAVDPLVAYWIARGTDKYPVVLED
ncbi:MAG TPA: DUF1877 family protein [Streptosporangiaceae bacterium]